MSSQTSSSASREPPNSTPVLRSKFVTRVAWFSIVLSAFAIAISLVQSILSFMDFGSTQGLPAVSSDWRTRGIFIALLVLSSLTFFVSVALLRRRWWARRAFLAIASAALAYHLRALLRGVLLPETLPTEGPADYVIVLRTAQIIGLLYPIIACALLIWILIKFQTRSVRDEFSKSSP